MTSAFSSQSYAAYTCQPAFQVPFLEPWIRVELVSGTPPDHRASCERSFDPHESSVGLGSENAIGEPLAQGSGQHATEAASVIVLHSMKVIVAGSRGITNYAIVKKAILDSKFSLIEIVSGGARGVDVLGERFATEHKLSVKRFIPDWDGLGKSAGFVRNKEMADYADALIAIWDGESRGTKNMIATMQTQGKKVFLRTIKPK